MGRNPILKLMEIAVLFHEVGNFIMMGTEIVEDGSRRGKQIRRGERGTASMPGSACFMASAKARALIGCRRGYQPHCRSASTSHGRAWVAVSARRAPQRVWVPPPVYSTSAAASSGFFPVQRTQIRGSAPTYWHKRTNSSSPTKFSSQPPQTVVNVKRSSHGPMARSHSYCSVVLPPKRMIPGCMALSAATTSGRQIPSTASEPIRVRRRSTREVRPLCRWSAWRCLSCGQRATRPRRRPIVHRRAPAGPDRKSPGRRRGE